MATALKLRVVTPARTVVDKEVRSVTFESSEGRYTVLPRHAPAMLATEPGLTKIVDTEGKTEEIMISDGFAEVRDNVLSLICEAGELAEEIDEERAKAAEERARQRVAERSKIDVDLPRAKAALRRALVRQMLARKRSGTGHV